MGQTKLPGLQKRGSTWHIDKIINGRRIRESCRTGSLKEANALMAKRMEEHRKAKLFGERPEILFETAAIKFIETNGHKRSLRSDIGRLRGLLPWIGEKPIDGINIGTLQPWVSARLNDRVAIGTINHGLAVVRRILNLAASEWYNEYNQTWLLNAPKIKLLPDTAKRSPRPITFSEQVQLIAQLPVYLAEMVLFMVNTGCRDQEVCQLRWEWETSTKGVDVPVFIVPGSMVKNGSNRYIVLNKIAASIVQSRRDKHPVFVFDQNGKPLSRMNNRAWRKARELAGLTDLRVHDLKHTFGARLRAAGVRTEDHQQLLGHKNQSMTMHYSAVQLNDLLKAANAVCELDQTKPEVYLVG